MTEHRVNPLQWLSTKFASLNHSHSEYLTSHQDITGKEDKSNKSSSITTDTGSTSKYPTVNAVEDYAQPKGNYLTQHQSLANYIQKSSTNGLLKNDGSVDTTQYLSSLPSHNHDDRYYTESEVNTALNGKANSTHTHKKSQITDFPSIPSKTSDLQNDSGFLTSHQSLANYVTTSDSRLSDSRTPIAHATSATTYGVSSASNYGHAMASSTSPKANGTAAVGSHCRIV